MSTTEQPQAKLVKRTCKVVQADRKPCGRVYVVPVGSKSEGCPQCCPRLDV